jgi:putative transposase
MVGSFQGKYVVCHCVFHTYYRKPVLVESVYDLAKTLIRNIASDKGFQLIVYAVMPDHVHLLLQLVPDEVPRAMNMFKGILSRRIFQQFPDLRLDMRSNHLWAAGYYARTVDALSLASTIQYIQNQGHPIHDL